MFLLINKPINLTSHDVIYQLRKITNIKTIGHAGTLDPFASGLLIIALERNSTKQLQTLIKLDKIYQATLQLGAISDTYDLTGKIKTIKSYKINALNQTHIKTILTSFIGKQLQTPPIYSAKKINGHKAYNLARKGQIPKLIPQQIEIYNIKLNNLELKNKTNPHLYQNYKLTIEIHCSSGTYIRSLAHDIGQQLKTGAYLTQLIRTHIGPFKLSQATNLKKINSTNWRQFTFNKLPTIPIKSRILIFGTFDLLHLGHINFIKQAAQLGDELYIVIARDKNVAKLKGNIPIHNENQRIKNIHQLGITHHIILGNLDWHKRYRIINKIKPNIIALGYDQKINLSELKTKLKKYNLKPQIKKLKAYQPNKYKTSIIKKNKS